MMAKVTNLGWAKPDDPIYTSGPVISFRPPLPAVATGIQLPANEAIDQAKQNEKQGKRRSATVKARSD